MREYRYFGFAEVWEAGAYKRKNKKVTLLEHVGIGKRRFGEDYDKSLWLFDKLI